MRDPSFVRFIPFLLLTLPASTAFAELGPSSPPASRAAELEAGATSTVAEELEAGATAMVAEVASSTTAAALEEELALELEGVEEVVVVGRADGRKEAAVLRERQRSAVVSDAISAQEVARTPDSNASDAVKRVVSATIVDGKYVLLRGLGGRYVSTLLNGVALPSPEPDEQAVPLDLFPASLLANLRVLKSYEPSLPGVFGGGALLIETNAYPSDLEFKIKLSTSGDSVTTFQDHPSQAGGGLDFFGFDDGGRALPASVPTDRPLAIRGAGADLASAERIAEDFSNDFSVSRQTAAPNLGLGLTLGDTTEIGGKKLGYLASLSFGHRAFTRRSTVRRAMRLEDTSLGVREELDNTAGLVTGTLGGLANVGLQLSSTDELNLFALYTHSGERRSQNVTGRSDSDNLFIDATRLQFVSRGLFFSQLAGRHRFPSKLELDWQGNASVTERSEPDTRDLVRQRLPDGGLLFKKGPGSGEHFFSELLDLGTGASAELALPLEPARLAAGASVQRSTRAFEARRFIFTQRGQNPEVLRMEPEEMLSKENIGPEFLLEERTFPEDAYSAALTVVGAHASADARPVEGLRVMAGARIEHAVQRLDPGSAHSIAQNVAPGVDRARTRVLPGANVVLALAESMNLRAAYSYTLARPQFRELAPFIYFDYARRRSVSGNPALEDTRIHNGDLRWEWFSRDSDVLAASVFYKRFERPIETVITSANQGDLGFDNAAGANAVGLEFEARGSLGFVHRALEPLRASGNLTLIRSRIELTDAQRGSQTSLTRPMQGQSPFVVNLGLAYLADSTGTELSVGYNVYGRRITEVGFDRLPDVYERPFHKLDVSLGQRLSPTILLKLSGTNLLDRAIVLEQGGVEVLRFSPGVSALASLEWSP